MIQRRAFLLASVAMLALTGPVRAFGAAVVAPGAGRTIRLPGARGPIELLEDRLGVPHIRAQSKHDAFFGQGYVTARDRLFQIDLAQRRELGRMAEAFGPAFLPADRAARLFHYHGDIDAELASLSPEVLECAQGYVAGVNARLAELAADPSQLPLEYGILGIVPLPWDVRDLVRIRNDGAGDAGDEVRRARLAARGLLHLDEWVDPLQPAHKPVVPEGLDCAAVSEADLGALLDAARPLPWSERAAAADWQEQSRLALAAQGSNAWTVAATRSATGRPILANDPHLGIGGASPRYIAHLTAPGLDVIGGGEPGLPGIMQGHTDRFAFGRTNFHIDQTDLFILRTREDDPEQYWHNGEWKRFETVTEMIAVKGAAPETVTLRYAQGRPIVSQDPSRHRAVAFASVSFLPGANMQFAIIAINLAHDWASLREAFRIHVSPTNIHYADVDGNTGWHAVGFAPKRPKHDGLFPAPGDGSFDWTGLLAVEDMPNVLNPALGWFGSANQFNLPADYPYRDRLSFTWTDPFRYERVAEVLSAQPHHRLEDSIALQHDVQSLPARALVAMLPAKPSPAAAKAVDLLRGWDGRIEAGSSAALLFETVMPALTAAVHELVIPPAARDLIKTVDLDQMLKLLATPDARLGHDPVAARDAAVDQALAAGWARAVELQGADPAKWRWGELHHVVIEHPLAAVMPKIAAAFPPIKGGSSGGDGFTTMARGVSPARSWNVTHGASYLFVADVGAWDNTRVLLLPGQSADPRSPHYRDWYDLWLAGDMQPLWFSKAAVDAHAVSRTVLTPA